MKRILLGILTVIAFTACGEDFNLEAPKLNVVQESKLMRRNLGDVDNYKETCLYFNKSFEKIDLCSISLQTYMSIEGSQVNDQTAFFHKLSSEVTFENFGIGHLTSESIRSYTGSEGIDSDEYQEGDLFYLRKSSSEATYEMLFKIKEVTESYIVIDYVVLDFRT